MKNFKFGDRSKDRKDFPRRSFGGGDSRRPLLHDAVCDECGKDCQVPFRPSGDKPVYCSNCFEKKGGNDSNRSRDRRDSSRRSFGGGDSRRSPQSNISDRNTSQLIEKIEILNTKLETIINLLSSIGQKKSGLVESRTEKNIKSKSTKADKNTEALTVVEKKDTKKAKTEVDSSVKNRV